VFSLLDALTALGRSDEVTQLRQGFEERSWRLTSEDVAVVAARLSAPARRSLPVDDSVPPGSAVDIPDFIRLYRPFVEALPGWPELLAATNRLLGARSWDALRQAAHEVFCDVLGFDDHPVPLTPRLRRRSAIADLEQIGSFAGFRVCVVRLTRSLSDTRWSSSSEHYRPCFRLVPRALLVSYEPGAGVIRLVFRQRHGRTESRPRYRCIVGPWFLRDPQENLLTICRRLDRCRPGLDRDEEDFSRRVQAALECSVGAQARDWTSAPVEAEGHLPGLALAGAPAALMRAFHAPTDMQSGEWRWGLAGHLSNVFPAPLRRGEMWLDIDHVKIIGEPLPSVSCWREARSRTQRLTLRLVLRAWDSLEVTGSFAITASLLVPDEQGWFWVEGRPYRYRPEVGSDGRLLSRTTMPDWVDQIDEDDPSVSDPDALSDQDRIPLRTAEGASVDAVIGRAIERRIWLLVKRLCRKANEPVPCMSMRAGQLRARMLATVPPGAALPLLTPRMARRLLTLVDIARPTADLADVTDTRQRFLRTPPAWACPDVSSTLEPDRWSVVAGARLHPSGELAIPMMAQGRLRLAVTAAAAFAVNPRLGAESTGDRSWWIHPRLAAFADLDAGVMEQPALVAAGGVQVRGKVAVSSSIRQAQLAPALRPRAPVLRAFVDVPKPAAEEVPPTLLVTAGQRLPPGAPWLRIPAVHLAHDHDDTDSLLKAVVGDVLGSLADGALSERLPWDCPVVVQAAGLEPVIRLGATTGWRAWIEVTPLSDAPLRVALPAGRLEPITPGWHPEDLPYDVDGEVFPIGLPGDDGEHLCFSGIDGEPTPIAERDEITVVPPTIRVRERAGIGAVDRLPRPGIRSVGESWCLTRLWWVASGRPAQWRAALSAGELHGRLLAWCAGLSDLPTATSCEEATAVPLVSRPHRAGAVLSEITWIARCACGRLSGAALLGASCPACGQVVGPRESLGVVRQVQLPAPVLHPWAKEIAAALLGLVAGELALLLTRHGPTPVLSALSSELSEPTAQARRRLDLPAGHPRALVGQARRRLGQMIELLESEDRQAGLESALLIQRVGVPSLDLVKVGNTLGEIAPTGSQLLTAFAHLHGACWAVAEARRLTVEPLLATAEVHLQNCVDAVFGEAHASEPHTLAGLMRSVMPWSRQGRPPVRAATRPPTRRPGSPDWWQRRAARAQLIERHAMDLLGLVASMPELGQRERQEVIKALATDLLDEQRDPQGLLTLLQADRDRPTQLPTEWSQAKDALSERLRPSIGEVSRPVVVAILGGWWMGEPSRTFPSGAVWLSGEAAGPPGFRRRVPPLSHILWRSWSGLRSVRPELGLSALFGVERFQLSIESAEESREQESAPTPVVRIVVSSTPLAESSEVAMAPETGRTDAPTSTSVETAVAPSVTEEIRVVTATIRAWLEGQ